MTMMNLPTQFAIGDTILLLFGKFKGKIQRGQASLMLFLMVGDVKLVRVETVNGILINELPFKNASDLQTAF